MTDDVLEFSQTLSIFFYIRVLLVCLLHPDGKYIISTYIVYIDQVHSVRMLF